jgi:hypothetical protein
VPDEPDYWTDFTMLGSEWEVQLNPYTQKQRHRRLGLGTREALSDDGSDWIPGPPPDPVR